MDRPCLVRWCVALAFANGACTVHYRHYSPKRLRDEQIFPPASLMPPAPPAKWPPTPWDDEYARRYPDQT